LGFYIKYMKPEHRVKHMILNLRVRPEGKGLGKAENSQRGGREGCWENKMGAQSGGTGWKDFEVGGHLETFLDSLNRL
jgi:hypothetical protein